jgi:hypothetical protein
MRWGFVLLSVLVVDGSGARADGPSFTRNYGEWTALSGPSKAAYAAGAFDMLALSGGSAEDLADSRGLSSCAIADGFTPKILAGMVDARYAAHPEEWSATATSALTAALIDVCATEINSKRRQSGLLAIPPQP